MIEKEQLVREIKQLPAMPRALVEMQTLLKQQNVNSERLEKTILTDPALTANILRLANSAAFGLTRKVADVSQAVTLMGHRMLSNLAHTAAFSEAIPGDFPGYRLTAEQFFRHSFAVGVLAESLAAACRLPVAQPHFVAGLLHDIGKLALGTYVARQDSELLQLLDSETLAFVKVERKVLGLDHCEVAVWVGEYWNLPPELLAAAQWHHSPDESPPELRPIVDVVHAADLLAHSLGYGADLGELARSISSGTLARLALNAGLLESVVSNVLERLNHEVPRVGHGRDRPEAPGPMRILVVDDSATIRQMVNKSLRLSGLPPHEIVEASNGAEALAILKEKMGAFAMVVADIHMPQMTGPELVAAMSRSDKLRQIPIVIISSDSNPANHEALRALGVRAFLKKPFRPEQFRSVIQPILRMETKQ